MSASFHPLGYLNENETRRYPFTEGSSLVATNQSRLLTNSMILDFLLVTSDVNLTRVVLQTVRTFDGEYGKTLLLSFRLIRKPGPGLATTTLPVTVLAEEIEPYNFISRDFDTFKLKIVFGPSILNLFLLPNFNNSYIVNLQSAQFTAELYTGTIYPVFPVVRSMQFRNIKEVSPVVYAQNFEELTWFAGTNTELLPSAQQVNYNVLAGAGEGLFDPCVDLPVDEIKSINGVNSEDFILATGPCHKLTHFPEQSSLLVDQICRPKCTATEVTSLAYYINRVQSGVNTVGGLASSVVTSLANQITQAEAAAQRRVVVPYLDIQVAATGFNSRVFNSIGIGIYDPNKKKIKGELIVSLKSQIQTEAYYLDNPEWDKWVLLSNPILKEDNNSYELPSTLLDPPDGVTVFTDRGVDCRGSAVVNMVVHGPIALTNEWIRASLVTYEGAVAKGTAFKHHTLRAVSTPYVDVRSRRGAEPSGVYRYQVVIDLFNSNTAWTGLTSFSVVVSSAHSISNAKLQINNGTVEYLSIGGQTVAFSNRAITYPTKAEIAFELELNQPNPVSLTIQLSVGAQDAEPLTLTFS